MNGCVVSNGMRVFVALMSAVASFNHLHNCCELGCKVNYLRDGSAIDDLICEFRLIEVK